MKNTIEQIEAKIYFLNVKKPLSVIFSSEEGIEKFIEKLENDSIIKLGQIIFRKEQFAYMIIEGEM